MTFLVALCYFGAGINAVRVNTDLEWYPGAAQVKSDVVNQGNFAIAQVETASRRHLHSAYDFSGGLAQVTFCPHNDCEDPDHF